MRLDAYLASCAMTASRSSAASLIKNGFVTVDGVPVTKCAYDVPSNALVEILENDLQPFVGRGGVKLAHALDVFGVDAYGRRCADIGASTGGFTDCLLSHGASFVYAVDAGHGQLDKRLAADARVKNLEGVNARFLDLSAVDGLPVGLAVMDVSFISQTLLYPALLAITSPGADVITLIKPQFEVGRAHIGKNGVVKDEKARAAAVKTVQDAAAACGFTVLGVTESPVKGGSGNTEYLMHMKKGDDSHAS